LLFLYNKKPPYELKTTRASFIDFEKSVGSEIFVSLN